MKWRFSAALHFGFIKKEHLIVSRLLLEARKHKTALHNSVIIIIYKENLITSKLFPLQKSGRIKMKIIDYFDGFFIIFTT
jgi:hypothetical protein